jgi:hypothetical protein
MQWIKFIFDFPKIGGLNSFMIEFRLSWKQWNIFESDM